MEIMHMAMVAIAFAIVASSQLPVLERHRRQTVIQQKTQLQPAINKPNENQQKPDDDAAKVRWRQYFDSCSKTCGGAYQKSMRTFCWSDKERKVLDDQQCTGEKPKEFSPCGQQPCYTPRWELGEWGSCSVSCGKGIMRKMYRCVLLLGPNSRREVEDRVCKNIKGDRPDSKVFVTECNTNVTCPSMTIREINECLGPQCKTTNKVQVTTKSSNGAKNEKNLSISLNSSEILVFSIQLFLALSAIQIKFW